MAKRKDWLRININTIESSIEQLFSLDFPEFIELLLFSQTVSDALLMSFFLRSWFELLLILNDLCCGGWVSVPTIKQHCASELDLKSTLSSTPNFRIFAWFEHGIL